MGDINIDSTMLPIFRLLYQKTTPLKQLPTSVRRTLTPPQKADHRLVLNDDQMKELSKYSKSLRGPNAELFFIIISEFHDDLHHMESDSDSLPFEGRNTNKRLIFEMDQLPDRLLCMLYLLMQMQKESDQNSVHRITAESEAVERYHPKSL